MVSRARILGLLIGLAALLAVVALLLPAARAVDQPIAFNHRLHVQDVGLDCTDCHVLARTGVRATIPNLELCAGCHEEPASGSENEQLLLGHLESGTPIPWKKVYLVPHHVYFSHRRHAAIAEIGCEECHGQMGEQEDPVTQPLMRITMDWCMDCHDSMAASNDCIACHR